MSSGGVTQLKTDGHLEAWAFSLREEAVEEASTPTKQDQGIQPFHLVSVLMSATSCIC